MTYEKNNKYLHMKNLFTITAVALFLVSFNTIEIAQKKDANIAKNLLDKVVAKAKSYKNMDIDFKYAINNAKENINQESKGTVLLQGNKYHLTFMGMTKIFDGKKTYTIVPEDEEITISTVNEKDDNAITPSKMLTFFNTGYKYNMDILQNVKGRKIQYIKLVPLNSRDQRKEVLLGIDVQTKHIYNLIEVGKRGTKTT